ncbi:MAG: VOC family protein [Hymenobacter sp.]|nr:MAG: VOC family protein [Hymenobacter sp.]
MFLPTALSAQRVADVQPKVRLNHIAVYVYNLEKSADFYKKIVQLSPIPNPFNDSLHEWFSIGGAAQLHLIKGAVNVSEHIKNSHICFSVPSVDSFITNLKRNRIGFTNWAGDLDTTTTRVDGVKQIYFKDPDGYWIEVNDNFN